MTKPEYKSLGDMDIAHAYFLDEESSLSQVFCFERNGELSGIIYDEAKSKNVETALKGLSLVLAQRIIDQEYIFEFIRK